MNKFSPLIKGVITGIVMVAFNLFTIYYLPKNSSLGYLQYIFYAGGITWTLLEFSSNSQSAATFKELFGQGFRCFIIVVLIMVAYSIVFTLSHPQMKEEYGVFVREKLVSEKNKTPVEVDQAVQKAKNQFTTITASGYLFGYLIPGAIFTLAASTLILMRRKQTWT
jgi:hypothetical protein